MIRLLPILALIAAPAEPAPAQQDSALRELIQDCSAHKFETIVSALVDGKLKRSKMKLCGVTGQSDPDWLRTLMDSADKIAANDSLAKPMRDEMVKAVNAEIAMRTALGSAPANGAGGGAESFSLKPRSVVPGGSKDSGMAGYTSLPPLPPPVSVAETAREVASRPFVPPPPIVRPDLRIECFSTTSVGEGPCTEFDRFTTIVVSAKSSLAPGSSLRFLRDGDERAIVDLGAMKKGQRQRIPLPAELCKSVNGGSLKIETLVLPKAAKARPQVADSDGPYSLRC